MTLSVIMGSHVIVSGDDIVSYNGLPRYSVWGSHCQCLGMTLLVSGDDIVSGRDDIVSGISLTAAHLAGTSTSFT